MRILLIEDNDGDAFLIQKKLSEASETPLEVVRADRLQAALQRLSEGGFDLILSDLGLPDSRGVETVSRLVQRAGGVPLVVVTGTYRDEAMALEVVRLGAQDYVVKENFDGKLAIRTLQFSIQRKRMTNDLAAAKQALQGKLDEIQQLNSFMVGREGRIVELKQEINELCRQMGQTPRYKAE